MLDEKLRTYNRGKRIQRITLVKYKEEFPFLKEVDELALRNCCGHKKEDLALHDRTWCCPACGETHDRDVNASVNFYFVGLGRPEVKPVERALVDDRSFDELPKKPSRDEAGSSTAKG